jgi:hypothetical protein
MAPTRTRNRAKAAANGDATVTPLSAGATARAQRERKAADKAASSTITVDGAPIEAVEAPATATPEFATPTDESTLATVVVHLFKSQQTIAAIARAHKLTHAKVRAILDEAGVDYSADKNSKVVTPGSSKPAPARASSEAKTVRASWAAIMDRPQAAKGSKRALVIAELDKQRDDLRKLLKDVQALGDDELARGMNALDAALSGFYDRLPAVTSRK